MLVADDLNEPIALSLQHACFQSSHDPQIIILGILDAACSSLSPFIPRLDGGIVMAIVKLGNLTINQGA